MNIFVILALALLIIMVLLRRHVPIGPAILAAGFFIWATTAPQLHYLPDALYTTLTSTRTYDLILALYFVMCLEIELRTGGVNCAPAACWTAWYAPCTTFCAARS